MHKEIYKEQPLIKSGLNPGLMDLATYSEELDYLYSPISVIVPKNFKNSYKVFRDTDECYQSPTYKVYTLLHK